MIKLPIGVNIYNLIDDLRIWSWEAADILIYYSKIIKDPEKNIDILKNNKLDDPVTLADLKVNETIIRRIKDKYKDIEWGILSEENVKEEFNQNIINSDWLWILDPLDGTRDFIQGTNDYAMHLALNYKGIPFIGVVLIPEKNELWISDGNKTWCEKRDGSHIKFDIQQEKNLEEMNLVTSKNHRNNTLNELIKKVNFNKITVMGSVGCKIASIIRGESDIYISLSLPGKSSPKDWDFAAPEAILKTAGGAIANINNKDLSYYQKNFRQEGIIIAVNNKNNHEKVCHQIKEII